MLLWFKRKGRYESIAGSSSNVFACRLSSASRLGGASFGPEIPIRGRCVDALRGYYDGFGRQY